MRLSIIVPVYNMEEEGRLQFCLDSLLAQTIQEYEIIAVDDASTDRSPAILKEYRERYPEKIKALFHKENKKQGGAKNTGLSVALGEYVGFVDSDDWVSPDCYEKLLKKAEETGADLVGCDYSLVSGHTYEVGTIVRNNSMDQTGILDKQKHQKLAMRPGSMVIKIYRREVLTRNHLQFPEGIFYEDNCAGTVWSFYFSRFEKVEEPLYYYYQHPASTVHEVTREKCENRLQAGRMLLKECRERGLLEEYYPEIQYRFTEVAYHITLFSYMLGAKKKSISFVNRLKKEMLNSFPDFRENPYYQSMTNEEEKRMVDLQMKNNLAFFLYYGCKVMVRKYKKKKQEKK